MKRWAAVLTLCTLACGGGPDPGAVTPANAGGAAAAPAAAPVARVVRAADVNGTRLHYRVVGDSADRATIVFIHGSLEDLRTWSRQEAAFARAYRVLVYSRRYHVPNPPLDDAQTYSPKLHAEDLAALLLTLDLAPAHIVGSSYGAYTALALARDHPQLVRSLVLAEPPMFPLLSSSEAGDAERRAFYTRALDPARAAFTRGDSVAALRAYYDAVTGPGRFDNLPAPNRTALLAHSFELRREMVANRVEYYPTMTCLELGRITTPVLLVRGERSPRMFQLISDELARCLRNDTTAVVPGAGHAVHATNPAYYNQAVYRYLVVH